MRKRCSRLRLPELEPNPLPAAAVILAVLGFLVDRRYEAGDPAAEDLDVALSEELERVEAMQCALWEDFDFFEELEPEDEGGVGEELEFMESAWPWREAA